MNKSEQIFRILQKNRLIAFLAAKSVEDCIIAYETLSPLGIILEIAFRTQAALEGIRATLKKYPDALIMAGTVMTPNQAESAIEAGVSGIISADYIPDVVDVCVRADIMAVPGGLSDAGKQLVQKAHLYGCDFQALKDRYPYQWVYKLFPATTADLKFISLSRAYKAAYKGLQMVYTGGISLTNLHELVQYDPEGIFCGSAVTKSIDSPEKMKEEAQKWLEIIHQ
ncbi:bifunctional 4-hydroxy-2-oxoglutarate aldolase/2-dehydro-3-deoxy-phosphogluconate aldolase [bacterium]|nr:bifunctional 4-hydroxy-2-oxoglutarate aldolase/2-dehydro-3-deoxy-phosphogluconate aldolase [bacterium]